MNPRYYTALRNYCTRYGIDWRFDTIQNPITLIWQVLKVVNQLTEDMIELKELMKQELQELINELVEDGTLAELINVELLSQKVEKGTIRYNLADYLSDELTHTQSMINALADAQGNILYIPSGTYTIKQILIPNNTYIEMSPRTVFVADSSYEWHWHNPLIDIRLVHNVTIKGNGAVIRMVKADYTTEHSHCIGIRGSQNVYIENLTLMDAGGDGVYIDGMDGSTINHSENVTIKDCIMDGNRRQGMSVLGVKGLLVDNCVFKNTEGTAPNSGVDIEPELVNTACEGIVFRNCRSYNNKYMGFLVALHFMNPEIKVDITFENCVDRDSNGFMVNGIQENSSGQIKFIGCESHNSRVAGFLDLNNHPTGIKRIYKDCAVFNHNTGNYEPNEGTSGEWGYGSAFLAEIGEKVGIGNISLDGFVSDSPNTYFGISLKSQGTATEQHGTVEITNYRIKRSRYTDVSISTWRNDNINLIYTSDKKLTLRQGLLTNNLNALFTLNTGTDENTWNELPINFMDGAVVEYIHIYDRVAKFYVGQNGTGGLIYPYTTTEKPALLLHKKGDRLRLRYLNGQWYGEVLAGTPTINIV